MGLCAAGELGRRGEEAERAGHHGEAGQLERDAPHPVDEQDRQPEADHEEDVQGGRALGGSVAAREPGAPQRGIAADADEATAPCDAQGPVARRLTGARHPAVAASPHRRAITPPSAATAHASVKISPRSAFSTSSAGGSKRSPYVAASSRERATKPGRPPS